MQRVEEDQNTLTGEPVRIIPGLTTLEAEGWSARTEMQRIIEQARAAAEGWARMQTSVQARFTDQLPLNLRLATYLTFIITTGERLMGETK